MQTLPWLLTSCTLLLAALPAQARSPELDRARSLLAGRAENEVREGGELCVRANNVAAVELLLEVLQQTERRSYQHLAPGHYRDIVWDSLQRITDTYARRRVEQEARSGKDPRVRQWCSELLPIYGIQGFGDTLKRNLSANDDDLQRWAARGLGQLRFEAAQNELQGLTRHKNDYVRANAIEALARIDPARHTAAFVTAITADKSGGVRCALLGAAAEVCPSELESLCGKALQDADWRPRRQAVEHLGRTKTKGAVDHLITALADVRPSVATRALRELQELTGQPIQQADVWARWWADHREGFAFPESRGVPARQQQQTVSYNGLPIDSDHAAFLLDKSFQMQQRLTSRNATKDEQAQIELKRVLELLDDKIMFQVVNYHTEVDLLAKAPIKLNAKSRARALEFAKAAPKGREKDIWQALATVVPDPTLDTVYLLSSGEPDTGLYVHWNRVTRHLADLNRFHKVTVHTVAYTDNQWFRDQLQKIAEVTGGHFETVQ